MRARDRVVALAHDLTRGAIVADRSIVLTTSHVRWRNHDAIERLVTGVRRANGARRVMRTLRTIALARGVCSRTLARTCDARGVDDDDDARRGA
jgi:hypothetical protein